MIDAPHVGDFGFATSAGGREVDPAEWHEHRPVLGLVREAGYLWGTLRDDDDRPLSFMRRLPEPDYVDAPPPTAHSLGPQLILQAAWDDASDMRMRKEAARAPRSDSYVRRMDGDRVAWEVPDAQGARVVLGERDARWTEPGIIDLEGERIGPGLHWYAPGREIALYYTSQTWFVAGTVLDRPVRGYLFYEEAYVPSGGRLYVARDVMSAGVHTVWYSWASEWDDHTVEFGHLVYGHDRFGMAVVANADGRVWVPRVDDCVVTRSADGYWHDRIDYVLDGEPWEVVAAPNGRMVDLGNPPNPQQEAIVRRAGEQRRPVNWMAWGESVPGHGDRRRFTNPLNDVDGVARERG